MVCHKEGATTEKIHFDGLVRRLGIRIDGIHSIPYLPFLVGWVDVMEREAMLQITLPQAM